GGGHRPRVGRSDTPARSTGESAESAGRNGRPESVPVRTAACATASKGAAGRYEGVARGQEPAAEGARTPEGGRGSAEAAAREPSLEILRLYVAARQPAQARFLPGRRGDHGRQRRRRDQEEVQGCAHRRKLGGDGGRR